MAEEEMKTARIENLNTTMFPKPMVARADNSESSYH